MPAEIIFLLQRRSKFFGHKHHWTSHKNWQNIINTYAAQRHYTKPRNGEVSFPFIKLLKFCSVLFNPQWTVWFRLSLRKTNIDLKLHSVWTKISLDIVKSFRIFLVSNLIFNTNLDAFSGMHVRFPPHP